MSIVRGRCCLADMIVDFKVLWELESGMDSGTDVTEADFHSINTDLSLEFK